MAGVAGEKTMARRRWKWKERKEKKEMESLLCRRSEGAQEGNILVPKKTRIRRETHPSLHKEKEIPETIVIYRHGESRTTETLRSKTKLGETTTLINRVNICGE